MSSDIFAMRALGVHVAGLLDRADDPDAANLADFFVPILKGWATEEALRVTSDAIQVHGGMGFIEETGVAQHYRDARIMPIYEGTTAIQSNDLVGRKVLRDGGATAGMLFEQMMETVQRLTDSDDEVARRIGARLAMNVTHAKSATEDVLGFAASPRDAFAVSVPYLTLLGVLAGGWMHALAVQAVVAHETRSDEDAARLTSADFYTAHHLPRVASLVETVRYGEVV
jgi:hypothetical protein